ncbi:MAG: hypothetical protein WBM90_04370, partial [Acidimicrobiia bacterium]
EELNRLKGLISTHRLVTVVGPGGMGKTRIAIAAAAKRTNTWMIRLESVREDEEVAAALLSRLGVESRGNPLMSAAAALRQSQALLILDNCEHVIDASAELAATLLAETDATVLATSREPLRVPGERVVSLGPMEPTGAVALYRDRAMSVNPSFASPDDEITKLCSRLDYMPLAIEMAAARSMALRPSQIEERLERRYGLLDTPRRGETKRHQSLDDMVAWSYDLLDEPSKLIFQRLSVMSDAFDTVTATTIAGFGEVDPDHVPATVADLVERSMLQPTDHPDEVQMLGVIKSFARSQLETSGDRHSARRRHARRMGEIAREIARGMAGPDEALWIDLANRVVSDLASALGWSVNEGDLDSAGMILEGLFDWFYHRQPPAIVDWGEKVMPAAVGHECYPLACAWAALAAMKRADLRSAQELAKTGIEVEETTTSRFAWFMAGDIACYLGQLDRALDAYDRQLVRASAANDDIGVIDATGGQVLALAYQGFYDRALAIAQGMKQAASRIEAPTYLAYADYAYGEALLDTDLPEATRYLENAISRSRSVNNRFIEGMALTTLGSALGLQGDYERALSA